MRAFGGGQQLTLHRRAPELVDGERVYDDYGSIVMTDTSEILYGVAIWPESATEVTQSMTRTNTVYFAALPIEIDVDAIDHATWQGRNYEVQGEAMRYNSPFSITALQTIRLQRVEG